MTRPLLERIRARPVHAALAAIALGASLYVVVAPWLVAEYPPVTDLPFHAAYSAALRHYLDPSWHFREQFALHPLAVPYLSMYAIAALAMLVLPPIAATKLAGAVMLALVPAGLAVLFRGMNKSPLLALASLPFVWSALSCWGFLNFVGALGLFAMTVGWTMLILRRPTRPRRIALATTLVVLFFTHIFRFPFALAAVVGTAVVVAPRWRRVRPLVLPVAPGLALFALWGIVRPKELSAGFGPLAVHRERLGELTDFLFGSFTDPAEHATIVRWAWTLFMVGVASAVALVVERRPWRHARARWRWTIATRFVPIACALVFLGLFLVLPMQIGAWWYVYPREATATAFIALAALPDLPKNLWVRASLAVALASAGTAMGHVVVRNFRAFDAATRDYDAITREIPKAPKLLYLVFEHAGSTRTTTPFIHLPAYVQAERGGWLSFHFAVWGVAPIVYRSADEPGAVVPPPVPLRWEWTPNLFRVQKHGPFFDWFLVRSRVAPDALFRDDPSIERVDQVGTWWLYHRR